MFYHYFYCASPFAYGRIVASCSDRFVSSVRICKWLSGCHEHLQFWSNIRTTLINAALNTHTVFVWTQNAKCWQNWAGFYQRTQQHRITSLTLLSTYILNISSSTFISINHIDFLTKAKLHRTLRWTITCLHLLPVTALSHNTFREDRTAHVRNFNSHLCVRFTLVEVEVFTQMILQIIWVVL